MVSLAEHTEHDATVFLQYFHKRDSVFLGRPRGSHIGVLCPICRAVFVRPLRQWRLKPFRTLRQGCNGFCPKARPPVKPGVCEVAGDCSSLSPDEDSNLITVCAGCHEGLHRVRIHSLQKRQSTVVAERSAFAHLARSAFFAISHRCSGATFSTAIAIGANNSSRSLSVFVYYLHQRNAGRRGKLTRPVSKVTL